MDSCKEGSKENSDEELEDKHIMDHWLGLLIHGHVWHSKRKTVDQSEDIFEGNFESLGPNIG